MITTDDQGALRVSHRWRRGYAVLNMGLHHCYLYIERDGTVWRCWKLWQFKRKAAIAKEKP